MCTVYLIPSLYLCFCCAQKKDASSCICNIFTSSCYHLYICSATLNLMDALIQGSSIKIQRDPMSGLWIITFQMKIMWSFLISRKIRKLIWMSVWNTLVGECVVLKLILGLQLVLACWMQRSRSVSGLTAWCWSGDRCIYGLVLWKHVHLGVVFTSLPFGPVTTAESFDMWANADCTLSYCQQ